jgi:hypothetical protein
MRLQAAFPVNRHFCLRDELGIGDHIRFRELEGRDPGGVKAPTHLTEFVNTTLDGENPMRDKGAHDIVCRNLVLLAMLSGKPNDPVCLSVGLLQIEKLVYP